MAMDHKRLIDIRIISLARLPYDHDAAGGLPMRPDVRAFARDYLFGGPNFGVSAKNLSRLDESEVSLHQDGTLTISMMSGERSLFLDIPCSGVVTYVKQFEDDATTIEGVVKFGDFEDDASKLAEIDGLVEWLIRE